MRDNIDFVYAIKAMVAFEFFINNFLSILMNSTRILNYTIFKFFY